MNNNEIRTWQNETALQRFQMISPLLEEGLDASAKVELRKKIAADNNLSERTLRRYEQSYRERSFEGLLPQSRAKPGPTPLPANFDELLAEAGQNDMARVNVIRSDVRELLVHYEQIIDMTQELEENENGFFSEANLRYMHLFMNRMARRHDSAVSLRDHTIQVRDLYNAQLEVRQNRTMTLLTVVTTIFMPLTLIAGWYGMNFRYMPELNWPYGYPVVIAVSVAIVVFCLIFFKKKKWL